MTIKIDHFYTNIPGWFDFDDIYRDIIGRASNGAHFVEVGSWKGKSAAFMCVEIANSGKNIRFDCVDIWTGAGVPGEYDRDKSVKEQTLYEEFINYMKPVEGLYTPVKEWSDKAAARYQDRSLDFVFIDAGHAYENVSADIRAWLPKVKPGGAIGGHDYPSAEGVRRAVQEQINDFTLIRNSWMAQVL